MSKKSYIRTNFGYFTQGSNLLKNIFFMKFLLRPKPPRIYKNDLIKKCILTKKLILCEVPFEISIYLSVDVVVNIYNTYSVPKNMTDF